MHDRSQTPPIAYRTMTRPVRTPLHCLDPKRRMFTSTIPPEAASEADHLRQLQAAIATRLERGDTLEAVERDLIAPSGLPEDQQHGLWLYAWSHPKRRAAPVSRLSVWTPLANALLTLIGIYRY
jgi:hypothetical protein